MTLTSPVVEWRSNTTPFPVTSSLALSGSGFSGAIPVGTSSSVVTIRLYNNFVAAANIADATNCVLAAYDDAIHDGTASGIPSLNQYLQVEVTNYNGGTANVDTQYFGIGASVKHPIPTNSGTISGTGANYVTISLQAVIPANAIQGSVNQGLWVEYSSTA